MNLTITDTTRNGKTGVLVEGAASAAELVSAIKALIRTYMAGANECDIGEYAKAYLLLGISNAIASPGFEDG